MEKRKRTKIQVCIDESTEQRIIECAEKFKMEKNDFVRFVLNSFIIANDDKVNITITQIERGE